MAVPVDSKTGTTRWQATKQWARKPTVTRGSTAVLVAAFIASSDTIYGIINDGIAGKPMNHWVIVKVLFVMSLAGAHNLSTYTDDTHANSKKNTAPPMSESEWLKSNIPPPSADPNLR